MKPAIGPYGSGRLYCLALIGQYMFTLHTSTNARLAQASTIQVYIDWCTFNLYRSTTDPHTHTVDHLIWLRLKQIRKESALYFSCGVSREPYKSLG